MSGDRSLAMPFDRVQIERKRFKDEKDIMAYVNALHAGETLGDRLTWREISELLFDGKIHPATLSAYARGTRPVVNREHRRLLLIKSDDRNRIVINADDPESGAITILTARKPSGEYRAGDDYVARLVELLQGL